MEVNWHGSAMTGTHKLTDVISVTTYKGPFSYKEEEWTMFRVMFHQNLPQT